jgi:hypothetical protein
MKEAKAWFAAHGGELGWYDRRSRWTAANNKVVFFVTKPDVHAEEAEEEESTYAPLPKTMAAMGYKPVVKEEPGLIDPEPERVFFDHEE